VKTVCDQILSQSFYARSVLDVAPDLLGKYLISDYGEGIITEVEAYDGPKDLACHGRFGKTDRTEVMFGPGGYWYVYLIYGMYHMFNVVTGKDGYPSAVLIRAVSNWNGPGKLTKAMNIDKSFNGVKIDPASKLWIEDRGIEVKESDIIKKPRIGVDYAGKWAKKPYRFLIRS